MKEEVLERKADGNGSLPTAKKGLEFRRYFTREGISPYDAVEWEYRTAAITNESGEAIFEQKDVEAPKSWSMTATNIVASKYFHGKRGTPERETSVRQLVGRVATTITGWGRQAGYFANEKSAEIFHDELVHLLLNQMMAFNSPVWFNCGVETKPQCSACFINAVEDTMGSILELAKTEGMLFKWGSGTGSNLSPIRSSKEQLSGGGIASGPVSFMKGFDAFAGVIKSGGKTRRAAKMVILNMSHPDIVEFINSKANEEKKAWVLLDNGYAGGVDGEAYSSIFFQNANHSVRVTDEFMHAVLNEGDWQTKSVVTGETVDTYKARDLMRMMSESAYICGDPGMQYDTTVNRWHTSKNTAPINASNPCSEYMFLDDSACNLASLNLMLFRSPLDGSFDVEAFKHAVDVVLLAQEIIVGFSKYPTPKIEVNSHAYRPLGLGYANLGALLMATGLPYDSVQGRNYAAGITSLMCGEAYRMSAKMAEKMGAFSGYAKNAEPMLRVIGKHRRAAYAVAPEGVSQDLFAAQRAVWDEALALGSDAGYRNSQVTVLAPTGTIGFMMDCDTTGIEPDIALIKYKKLVGGGMLKIVNNTVPLALQRLGYSTTEAQGIISYLDQRETIEGAPGLKTEHLPVFDCAFKPAKGERSIHWLGHLRMMGATQPFLSGAISKTVNLPTTATMEDIEEAYLESWKLGLKAVAVYRDGCKRSQPLNTSKKANEAEEAEVPAVPVEAARAVRRRLPDERKSITHKFSIGGHEGYLTVGMYDDGTPGELFVVMAKEGSVVSGLMDSFATAISLSLQYGVPLHVLADKFSHTRFEPSGFTGNPDIPIAKSITDYIFRWLALKFDKPALEEGEAAPAPAEVKALPTPAPVVEPVEAAPRHSFLNQQDAPPCHTCGAIMYRSGACYKCNNCGATSGCS